jgi:hypothetical protein
MASAPLAALSCAISNAVEVFHEVMMEWVEEGGYDGSHAR